jgi:hypothetical protein
VLRHAADSRKSAADSIIRGRRTLPVSRMTSPSAPPVRRWASDPVQDLGWILEFRWTPRLWPA